MSAPCPDIPRPNAAELEQALRSVAAATIAADPANIPCAGCGHTSLTICRYCGESGACAVCIATGEDGGWSCSTCAKPESYVCRRCLQALNNADPAHIARHYEAHAAERFAAE